MAQKLDFSRRLNFVASRLAESGQALLTEANKEYRAIAERALARSKALTPRSPDRPDKEPTDYPLSEGWRLVETGSVTSDSYSVEVVNDHDRPLTSKTGTVYTKANGQFFTLLDALDVGVGRHDITSENTFFFWWQRESRYFVGEKGKTVIDHPGFTGRGVLRIPRTEAAREAKNLRRRLLRKAARLGGG